MSGADVVGFTWQVLLAFIRVSTNPRIFATALSLREACDVVAAWLGSDSAQIVGPGPTHLHRLTEALLGAGKGGNLVPDAHLAALAAEHRAQLVTFDRDFLRFPGVEVVVPV